MAHCFYASHFSLGLQFPVCDSHQSVFTRWRLLHLCHEQTILEKVRRYYQFMISVLVIIICTHFENQSILCIIFGLAQQCSQSQHTSNHTMYNVQILVKCLTGIFVGFRFMMFMVALAVGTLAGSGILVLIPEVRRIAIIFYMGCPWLD